MKKLISVLILLTLFGALFLGSGCQDLGAKCDGNSCISYTRAITPGGYGPIKESKKSCPNGCTEGVGTNVDSVIGQLDGSNRAEWCKCN